MDFLAANVRDSSQLPLNEGDVSRPSIEICFSLLQGPVAEIAVSTSSRRLGQIRLQSPNFSNVYPELFPASPGAQLLEIAFNTFFIQLGKIRLQPPNTFPINYGTIVIVFDPVGSKKVLTAISCTEMIVAVLLFSRVLLDQGVWVVSLLAWMRGVEPQSDGVVTYRYRIDVAPNVPKCPIPCTC